MRLFEVYKAQVDEDLFETAVAAARTEDLDNMTAALLDELKQPSKEIDLGTRGQAPWSRYELHDRDV